MTEASIQKARASLLGAVVADSAAMGLHWIYDTARLAEVGGESPEFRVPDPGNYEGVVGVFAHGGRPVGASTRYGATVHLVADQMNADGGAFDGPAMSARFLATFGYGGSFIGYVDHPAAGTLDVIRTRDAEIEGSFGSLTDRIPFHTIVALGPSIQAIASAREVGDARGRLTEAIGGFGDIELDEEQMSLILGKIDDLHGKYWNPTGVSDLQLPVLAPVIPVALAASTKGLADETLREAVRQAAHLTHVDEDALLVGDFVALLIKDVVSGTDLRASIDARVDVLPDELAAKVKEAVGTSWASTVDAANELGMSCALAEGLPLSLVTLLGCNSYTDAVRTTILCGGDSCGRGLLVGALAGLLWGEDSGLGIPSEWIERAHDAASVREAARALISG